jgi:hypothetical protein
VQGPEFKTNISKKNPVSLKICQRKLDKLKCRGKGVRRKRILENCEAISKAGHTQT